MKLKLNDRTKSILSAAAQDVVETVAPNLGRVLRSPIGEVALNEIKAQFNIPATASPGKVSEEIVNASPEQLNALIERDIAFEKIAAEDTQHAREAHAGTLAPLVLTALAFAALGGFGVALFYVEPTGSARDSVMLIIGALITMSKQGYDFFLGSSAGSKQKTALIGAK